jgi:acyl carrier protein
VALVPEGYEVEGLEALLQQPITWSLVKISPMHLSALGQRQKGTASPGAVCAFVIGGEALMPATVALWQSISPATRLINEYGPTETVVGCTVYEVPIPWSVDQPVPIGRPIANTRIYILDSHGRPVPIGVSGEIYIGGAGVARGYLNQPQLTAERFVKDPFQADGQGRMYRSGDLGRWRADGTIEYLGRNDSQVKIRGYRIELGEIEAQLLKQAQVREAVVLAREDAPGQKRLVAYYTVKEEVPAIERLREQLAGKLPQYMVPSAYVRLESMPLLPNGKLDRRALPAPAGESFGQRGYEAPQGEVEEILAAIWQELLRVERVGRHDNFFELGGHSLLATQLVARLTSSLAIEISLRQIFEFPILRELAAQVGRLHESYLIHEVVSGGIAVEELLERVSSMSESEVQKALAEPRMGVMP